MARQVNARATDTRSTISDIPASAVAPSFYSKVRRFVRKLGGKTRK